MKFCPKCGALLLPRKEGNENVLKCPKCGHVERLESGARKAYTLSGTTNTTSKVKTTSIVSEGGRRFRSKEEFEQEKEEYYEIFLDLMHSEELEGEEGREE